jgi:hypothetical protein
LKNRRPSVTRHDNDNKLILVGFLVEVDDEEIVHELILLQ